MFLTRAWRALFGPKTPNRDCKTIAAMPAWDSFMSYYKEPDGTWQPVGCYRTSEAAWESLRYIMLPLDRKMVLRAAPYKTTEDLKGL